MKSISDTKLNYLIQKIKTMINSSSNNNHTHNYAGSDSPGGSATSAKKLANKRTFLTDLGSSASAEFDGTANASVGVKGVLPVANGGTGLKYYNPKNKTNIIRGSYTGGDYDFVTISVNSNLETNPYLIVIQTESNHTAGPFISLLPVGSNYTLKYNNVVYTVRFNIDDDDKSFWTIEPQNGETGILNVDGIVYSYLIIGLDQSPYPSHQPA